MCRVAVPVIHKPKVSADKQDDKVQDHEHHIHVRRDRKSKQSAGKWQHAIGAKPNMAHYFAKHESRKKYECELPFVHCKNLLKIETIM